MRAAIIGVFVLATAPGALAQANEMSACTTLSFAPLDRNVLACTALIERPDSLDGRALAAVYASRAAAYEFAVTYHGDHAVRPADLLAAALADLDRAVETDPRHHARRGDILYRLSRFEEAATSFTAALAADPASAPQYLEQRSLARIALKDADGTVADLTAAIQLAATPSDRRRLLLSRAGLFESSSRLDDAIADYRLVLRASPADVSARAGLERLGADPG